jgi:Helicase associated domain
VDMGLSESCEEGFKHLLEYIKRHGDARVPHSYVAEKHRLGGWDRKQRSRNARRTLDPDRKRRLEMLPGWIWDTNVDQWEDGYVRLLEYVDRHGDARVPRAHEVDGYRLGAWVNNTRNRRANGIPERQERLEKLPGWSWDPHTDKWEKGFKYLVEFIEHHGDALVPTAHVVEKYNLGSWAKTQRRLYTRGELSADRVDRLKVHPGWEWNRRPGRDQ